MAVRRTSAGPSGLRMSGVAKREFSLRQQQGDVRAVYVPLARLQRDLNQPDKVNTILASASPGIDRVLKEQYTLADLGLKLRVLDQPGCLSLESDSTIVSDALDRIVSSTAQSLGLRAQPVLTYLANRIRAGGRETPYSVVTALDSAPAPARQDGITLNEWAARDLGAKVGDPVNARVLRLEIGRAAAHRDGAVPRGADRAAGRRRRGLAVCA